MSATKAAAEDSGAPPDAAHAPQGKAPENAVMRGFSPSALCLLPALCLWLLASCAPSVVTTRSGEAAFRAAFSAEGVAWVSGGAACVARMPAFQPVCPRLPPVTDVAWNGSDAWAAVPGLGVVVTLDRAARSVLVGRVLTLSNSRVYRQDGSALNYAGEAVQGVVGGPSGAITGGDGGDYVVLAGALKRVSDGVVLETHAKANLVSTPTGARTSEVPALDSVVGSYQLVNGRLERLDTTGRVLVSVPHGPGRVGLVGAEIVTVSPQGAVRVFTLDLQPLQPR